MCARKRAGKADITPTLVDLERTHILYVNAHFKPLMLGVVRAKTRASGTRQFSSSCVLQRGQIAGKSRKLLVPPFGSDARNGTPGKLGKKRCEFNHNSGQGKKLEDGDYPQPSVSSKDERAVKRLDGRGGCERHSSQSIVQAHPEGCREKREDDPRARGWISGNLFARILVALLQQSDQHSVRVYAKS